MDLNTILQTEQTAPSKILNVESTFYWFYNSLHKRCEQQRRRAKRFPPFQPNEEEEGTLNNPISLRELELMIQGEN